MSLLDRQFVYHNASSHSSSADFRERQAERQRIADRERRAAIEAGGTLDMGSWHACETTHCRAGWAITLAGEAGAKLESEVGPAAAGALIYAKSCPDKPIPNFYASTKDALADIKARAGEQQ